jgi:ABC-2 type transport system permease protein
MTATTAAPASASRLRPSGSAPFRLVKAELLKIWTTNSWWIFAIVSLATTGLALLLNIVQANSQIDFATQHQNDPLPQFNTDPSGNGPSPEDEARMQADFKASIDLPRILVTSAANIYTSGQFFGLVFMVILGVLVVTNEFFHQTATTTFLTTPHRTRVIVSKFIAAILLAFGFWFLITAIDLSVGSIYFGSNGHQIPLTDWPVLRSVLMNLLAFVVWVVLGVALGVLIRSQLGATITAALAYLLSFPAAFIVFGIIRQFIIKKDWVLQWIVIVPGVASQIMINPVPMQVGPGITTPAWWVGALVLVGYGAVAAVLGTLITRKRDIS